MKPAMRMRLILGVMFLTAVVVASPYTIADEKPGTGVVVDKERRTVTIDAKIAPRKIDDFVELMRPVGLVEVSRTGVVAIARGPEGMLAAS